MILTILGREPDLSLAELESRFRAETIKAQSTICAVLESNVHNLDIDTFGGLRKVAEVVDTLDTVAFNEIAGYIKKHALAEQVFDTSEPGKKRLGISVYGDIKARPRDITGLGLALKKRYKQNLERSIGVVPNDENYLSTAQVFHNRLDQPAHGRELIIARIEGTTYIALTTGVQNIEYYSNRDFNRPARDAEVGMLPPKLAQILVNIAAPTPTTLLDPFCGTGVLLQEALLLGHRAVGSDVSPRMVNYTEQNLTWLNEQPYTEELSWKVDVGDATQHTWPKGLMAVASELDLGKPLDREPTAPELERYQTQTRELLIATLTNLSPQLPDNARLCLATPAWRRNDSFHTALPTVDELNQLGYTEYRFAHVRGELIYAREDQFTGRRLLVLNKKI